MPPIVSSLLPRQVRTAPKYGTARPTKRGHVRFHQYVGLQIQRPLRATLLPTNANTISITAVDQPARLNIDGKYGTLDVPQSPGLSYEKRTRQYRTNHRPARGILSRQDKFGCCRPWNVRP